MQWHKLDAFCCCPGIVSSTSFLSHTRKQSKTPRYRATGKSTTRVPRIFPITFEYQTPEGDLKMTPIDIEASNQESNAKLWAKLSLDSATLISAQFASADGIEVQSTWSQRDVVASRKRRFTTTYIRAENGKYRSSPPIEVFESTNPVCYYSPSRQSFLKFTTKGDGDGDSVMVEVWTVGAGLDIAWEVKTSTHGPVYTDEWFGSVAWSPDETLVAYVADRGKTQPRTEKSGDQQHSWITPLEHTFHENARDPIGEAYINRRSPSLFIADLVRGRSLAATKDSLDGKKDYFFGDPQWSPDGKHIVTTMRRSPYLEVDHHFESDDFWPTDLGVRYCYNRRSAIVIFSVAKLPCFSGSESFDMHVLSSEVDNDDFSCISPRFSLDGKNIVYISNPGVGDDTGKDRVLPHNMTKMLRCIHILEDSFSPPQTLISIPLNPSPDEFPGLYLHSLPERPFIDSKNIVFTSSWGSINRGLSAELHLQGDHFTATPGALQIMDWTALFGVSPSNGGTHSHIHGYNISIMDTCSNHLLLSASKPSQPTELFAVRYKTSGKTGIFPVSYPSLRSLRLQSAINLCCTYNLVTETTDLLDPALEFDAEVHDASRRYQVTILLPNETGQKKPLIVFPHGGPHVSTVNTYSQGAMALLKRGFAVLYINYRGSLGLGQASLETLPGRIGAQDICEVVQAARWALQQPSFNLNSDRVGFVGGSHSGFIGAHTSLISGLFKRTVLRNPVVNIATMVGATDIPDWCFCEAGLPKRNKDGFVLVPDAEMLKVMYEVSPVSRVRKGVKDIGRTFLQVGGGDRRVPPEQSLEWKRVMTQAFGSDSVVLRWYPGSGHSIDEVPNGDDAWVHALDFVCEL